MEIGVFIPIGNNGWLLSENAPQYKPTFELNKEITLRAEGYGLDFVLSMIKLRGLGGKTEFWDHNLESFTLMAGLAAVTSKIKLFATSATLVMPPAIVARMAATIDSISNGRFGLNVITGWQRPEYSQMGLWPGDEYFSRRYEYLAEYVQVLRELWANGQSDFKGDFFKMEDCRVSPRPQADMKIICAGGEWVNVPVIEGSFIVNIGDLMQQWTNDQWTSTMHRVINPPPDSKENKNRLSRVLPSAELRCHGRMPAELPIAGRAGQIRADQLGRSSPQQ